MTRKPEITAPVGSFESLWAAIQAGAKSIYFGAGNLNMRSKSTFNFSLEDLFEIQKIANRKRIRTYLAVNTVIYDNDLPKVDEILAAAKEAGINAIIASDFAVILRARKFGLTVHCSTQLNISNIEAVRFFAQYADVMVLARELSLEQTKRIIEQIHKEKIFGPSGKPVRIEIFAHGALCMAISGKCYLSLHLQDHSANRGECLQVCRRKYIVTEKEHGYELEIDNEYIMSPKDLATIAFLDKIIDAGVDILKIEGRGRSPEYVKRTVECYREAIDAVFDGSYIPERIEQWKKRLAEVYNRGFWDGYYLGQTLGEWNNRHGSSATKKKVYVGYVQNYYSKVKAAAVQIQADELALGDDILIIGNKTGVLETKVQELRLDDIQISKVTKGDLCSIPLSQKVRPNDKVYKFVDNQ
jgi:putative protease